MQTDLYEIAAQKDREQEAANAAMMAQVNKANQHNDRWLRVAQKAKRYASDLPDEMDERILVMAEHMVDTIQGMRDRRPQE